MSERTLIKGAIVLTQDPQLGELPKADILVASLTSDAYITKADNRPFVPQELRAVNLAALEVVDYVLVHELAHLLVEGHGPAFWALVECYPRCERARGYLEGVALWLNTTPASTSTADYDAWLARQAALIVPDA